MESIHDRPFIGIREQLENVQNNYPPSYMSTLREIFEGQTTARRAKRGGLRKGGPGVLLGNFQKPVLQMVQSELFLSYICQYN